jgi:hypothetical protein
MDHVARAYGRDGQTGAEVSEGVGILGRKRKRRKPENRIAGPVKQARLE